MGIRPGGLGGIDWPPRSSAGQTATDPPDVVLLDIRMPGMGGMQFLEELHQSANSALRWR